MSLTLADDHTRWCRSAVDPLRGKNDAGLRLRTIFPGCGLSADQVYAGATLSFRPNMAAMAARLLRKSLRNDRQEQTMPV
jgi:hypothetical protein